jgi:LysM repeat protein
MFRRGVKAAVLAFSFSVVCTSAAAAPKTHKVYAGQTLGMIAKRYNVSVDALCAENGIPRSRPIKPGQELQIPGASDGSGKAGRGGAKSTASAKASAREEKAAKDKDRSKSKKPIVHTVYRGQTLAMIAKRYHVSIETLCHANGIERRGTIKPEQRLIVPGPGDADGSRARRLRMEGFLDDADDRTAPTDPRQDWRTFQKSAWRRGYVTLTSQGQSWKGYVIGPDGHVLPKAHGGVSETLASWRTGKSVDIDARLVETIARVSDTFGGRPIHVVSGYREHSHTASSRHPKGKALDFSIEGVPNWAVRDFLRTLDDVGVGYYPNSSFVHLDVRSYNAYWVDRSGPGEEPQYARQ